MLIKNYFCSFLGPSPPVITVSNGVFVRTDIQSLNETAVQFITSVDNNGWQAELYHSSTSCKDVNGNNLPNNECEITSPNTWTPEPVDLVLSSLMPGKEYTISLDQISFRNGNDPNTESSTFPASATFCTSKPSPMCSSFIAGADLFISKLLCFSFWYNVY